MMKIRTNQTTNQTIHFSHLEESNTTNQSTVSSDSFEAMPSFLQEMKSLPDKITKPTMTHFDQVQLLDEFSLVKFEVEHQQGFLEKLKKKLLSDAFIPSKRKMVREYMQANYLLGLFSKEVQSEKPEFTGTPNLSYDKAGIEFTLSQRIKSFQEALDTGGEIIEEGKVIPREELEEEVQLLSYLLRAGRGLRYQNESLKNMIEGRIEGLEHILVRGRLTSSAYEEITTEISFYRLLSSLDTRFTATILDTI